MDNEKRNEKLLEYLDKKVQEIDAYYPKLNVKSKASRASAGIISSPGSFEEVREKLDKTLDKLIKDYEEKCTEIEQEVMEARNSFDEVMNKVNVSSPNLNWFGETVEHLLVKTFKVLETVDSNTTLSDEEKFYTFSDKYTDMINLERQKMRAYISSQLKGAIALGEYKGRKEDPLLYVTSEMFRGYDSLDYKSVSSLYKIFKEDLTIIGTNFASSMSATIKNNEPIYYTRDYKYRSNRALFNFDFLDTVFSYANKNGKDLKIGGFLSPSVVPENLVDAVNKVPEENRKDFILAFLEDYTIALKEFLDSHKYTVKQFEALKDIANDEEKGSDVETKSFWYKYLGDKYYVDVLKIVKRYFDQIEVIYTDNNEYLDFKADHICGIVKNIQKAETEGHNVLIDAIGLGSHFDEFIEVLGRELKITDLYDTMPMFVKLGLPLYRTEYNYRLMDVDDETLKDNFIDTMLYVDGKCGVCGIMALGNSDSLTSNIGDDNETSFVDLYGNPKKEYHLLSNRYTGRVALSSEEQVEVLTFETKKEEVKTPEVVPEKKESSLKNINEKPKNVIKYTSRDDNGLVGTIFLIVISTVIAMLLIVITWMLIS